MLRLLFGSTSSEGECISKHALRACVHKAGAGRSRARAGGASARLVAAPGARPRHARAHLQRRAVPRAGAHHGRRGGPPRARAAAACRAARRRARRRRRRLVQGGADGVPADADPGQGRGERGAEAADAGGARAGRAVQPAERGAPRPGPGAPVGARVARLVRGARAGRGAARGDGGAGRGGGRHRAQRGARRRAAARHLPALAGPRLRVGLGVGERGAVRARVRRDGAGGRRRARWRETLCRGVNEPEIRGLRTISR